MNGIFTQKIKLNYVFFVLELFMKFLKIENKNINKKKMDAFCMATKTCLFVKSGSSFRKLMRQIDEIPTVRDGHTLK